jgi:hypothetical protein
MIQLVVGGWQESGQGLIPSLDLHNIRGSTYSVAN